MFEIGIRDLFFHFTLLFSLESRKHTHTHTQEIIRFWGVEYGTPLGNKIFKRKMSNKDFPLRNNLKRKEKSIRKKITTIKF